MNRPKRKGSNNKRELMVHARVSETERDLFWMACEKAGLDESSGLRAAMELFIKAYGTPFNLHRRG